MKKSMALMLVAALLVALVAGVAQARGNPVGKGNPVVTYVFKGSVVSAQEGSLTVDVEKGNRFARGYAGRPVEISVGDATRIVRDDAPATLADLASGDRVLVQSRAPRLGAESFTAKRVVAQSATTEDEPAV